MRFWDAFADLFAGQLVDRTMTRWGKFRPFFLFGSLPLLLSSVLCFSVPSSLVLYAFLFGTAKEQVQRIAPSVKLSESMRVAVRNTPLLVLCGSSLLFLTAMFTGQALGVCYARDVLGNANWFVWLGLIGTGSMVLASTFIPAVARTIGKRNGYIGFGVIALVGGLILWQAPTPAVWAGETATAGDLVLPFIGWGIYNIGVGGVNTIMWALEADTVEYGEWKTDKRIEGLTYSMFSFTRKMGQAIGGSLGVADLGYFLYNKDAATELPFGAQTEATIAGMKMGIGLFPAVVIALACLVMVFYSLTDERFGEILADLRKRRETPAHV